MKHIKLKKGIFITLMLIFIISIIINIVFYISSVLTNLQSWSLDNSREIERVTSPDSLVDAVLMENYGGGTTVGYSYEVYIVIAGEKPKERDEIFLADHIDSLKIKWRENYFLEIHYKAAKIIRFSNMWYTGLLGNTYYNVEIRLEPSTNSWSLPEEDRFRYPIIR